jgi:perosamine synthetase
MIPVFKPSYGDEEVEALRETLKSGWVGLGPKTAEFESKFANFIGSNHAIGTNSCTAALHLALKVSNLEGKEVITTPMTFISTNMAILYNNAIPVFCDIEHDTLNMDADKIESLISERTKALLAVHYGGHSCDMDKVLSLAKEYHLLVIEDCAHASGAEYKGKKLGSLGDFGCFSFHAVKNLAMGEGGAITTDDSAADGRLRKLRWMGISKDTWSREDKDQKLYSWYYSVDEIGYKYHMHDISAAIGLVQLKKLEQMNRRRKEIVDIYDEAFKDMEEIEVPPLKPYANSSCHNYVIKLDARDELNEYLKTKGISTGVHYIPNNHYRVFGQFRGETPVADRVWKRVLTLPVFPDLTEGEQQYVIEQIKDFFKEG